MCVCVCVRTRYVLYAYIFAYKVCIKWTPATKSVFDGTMKYRSGGGGGGGQWLGVGEG